MTTSNTNAPTTALGTGFGLLSTLFRTDMALENDGAWMIVGDGIRFKVRSQQSEKSRATAKQLAEEYAAVYASGAQSVAQSDAQDVEMCARALVTDWEGVKNDDGSPIACTEDSVRLILTGLPHLRRSVTRFSATLENYKPKA